MKKEKLVQWLFLPLIVLAALFCFIGLNWITLLASSLILTFYTAKFGVPYALTGLVPLFIVGNVTSGMPFAIFLCAHSFSAYCIGYFMHKRGKFSLMLIVSTLVEVSVLTGYTLYMCDILQFKPVDFLFGESMRQFIDILASTGQVDVDMLAEFRSSMHYIIQMLQTMLPVLYLMVSLTYVYCIFGISRFILQKQGQKIDSMPYFHELWLPGSISGIFIIMFFLSMFMGSPILMNVVSFMFMLHVVCGLSFANYILRAKKLSKALCALITVAILLISSMLGGFFTSILCCIGMSNGTRSARK